MTAAGPLRGPHPGGGGFAAADLPGRRAGYGAAPPASRLLRIAAATALRAGPDPGDHCGPSGRKRGQAQACPALARGAQTPGGGGPREQAERQDTSELAFDSQKERENYKPRVVSRIK